MQKFLTVLAAALVATTLLIDLVRAEEAQAAPRAAQFAIVINSANEAKFADDEAARQEVRKLFLKTATKWAGGEEAKPFAPEDGSDAQKAFLADVLGMSKAELARHWLSMKNKSGVAPPKEISSSKMTLKYVDRFDGGFGVVTQKEAEASKLRVLFSF